MNARASCFAREALRPQPLTVRFFGVRRLGTLVATLVLTAGGSCSRGAPVSACPGQQNPVNLSRSQLQLRGPGIVPERGATTKSNVASMVRQRRGYLEKTYRGVAKVYTGDGWGITRTNDQYGNITYHRRHDYMVVVEFAAARHCPDTSNGTLALLDPEGRRVPIKFVHRA